MSHGRTPMAAWGLRRTIRATILQKRGHYAIVGAVRKRSARLSGNGKERTESMNPGFKEEFLGKWQKYFGGAELPVAFYYTDEEGRAPAVEAPKGHQCVIGVLNRVRRGAPVSLNGETVGCGGGKGCLGFPLEVRPDFKYFLSTGIPGKLEGERYKKTPELAEEIAKGWGEFRAPAKNIVFKRWDLLEEADEPEVVAFFAKPDVLAALFTLANFDRKDPAVYAPFGAGCSSVVQYPYREKDAEHPRCVLGMFDITARPYVEKDVLSFAVPMKKFLTMVADMDESFLIARDWEKVRKRL